MSEGRHYYVGPDEGRSLFVLGDAVTYKVPPAVANNHYFLVEIESEPGGGAAFLHTHVPQETFWILEGEYEVYGLDPDGEKYTIEAGVGSTVHIGGNVPHGFHNVSGGRGRLLALYAPVTNQPEFFEEIGIPMDSVRSPWPFDQMPSNDRIMAVLDNHEMRLLEDLPGE